MLYVAAFNFEPIRNFRLYNYVLLTIPTFLYLLIENRGRLGIFTLLATFLILIQPATENCLLRFLSK